MSNATAANKPLKISTSTNDTNKNIPAATAKPAEVPATVPAAETARVPPPPAQATEVPAQPKPQPQPQQQQQQPAQIVTSEPAPKVEAEPSKKPVTPAAVPQQTTSTTAPAPVPHPPVEQRPVTREPEPSQAAPIASVVEPAAQTTQPAVEQKTTTTTASVVESSSAVPAAKSGGALSFWTPENKDAKKRYDRDFLISLSQKKLSQKFPDVLNGLEIAITAENTVSTSLSAL